MFDIINGHMPIKLQMALSNNRGAFYAFLHMSDSQQDIIIEKASGITTYAETASLVAKIAEGGVCVDKNRLK